jgi:hypothetical protein
VQICSRSKALSSSGRMQSRIRVMAMCSGLASSSLHMRPSKDANLSARGTVAVQTHALSLSLLVRIPSRRARHNSLAAHADWNPVGDSLRWFELEDQDGAINE